MTATLVFSVALGGYAYKYRDCLASQRRYAVRHGYRHVTVARPLTGVSAAHSAWLKVPLMLRALESGYDTVLFLDADCEVRRPDVPVVEAFAGEPGDVQMALGRSGRLNSGVIAARRSDASTAYFRRALQSVTEPMPEADRRDLKYENGNLIHCARLLGGVGVLPESWNNTTEPALDDIIRHYTGPLRSAHRPPFGADRAIRALRSVRRQEAPGPQPERRTAAFAAALEELASRSLRRYPELQR